MSVNIKYYALQFFCMYLALTSSYNHSTLRKTNDHNKTQLSELSEPDPFRFTGETTELTESPLWSDNDTVSYRTSSLKKTTVLQVTDRYFTPESEHISQKDGNCIANSNSGSQNYLCSKPEEVTVRKCLCKKDEFRNSESEQCESINDSNKLVSELNKFSNKTISIVHTYVAKLQDCFSLQTPLMNQNPYYFIVNNGTVFDAELNITYSHSEYCVELIGGAPGSSELLLALCPRQIPKCCQIDHYFDVKKADCLPYGEYTIKEESLLNYFINKDSGYILSHNSQFVCSHNTLKVDMKTAHINGSNICVWKTGKCYGGNKFCIDNMMDNNASEMIQAAYVCPETFINKCCPDGKGLRKGYCVQATTTASLMKILDKHLYHVRNISDQSTECDPFIIKNDIDSGLAWTIDEEDTAVININNKTTKTNQFCVDDYINGTDIYPVLNVCSNVLEEFHEYSYSPNLSENVIRKCCPPNTVYYYERAQCKPPSTYIVELTEIEELQSKNISHLQYAGFPQCSKTNIYHSYDLEKSGSDYSEFTSQGNLKIIHVENNCSIKETELKPPTFCLEFTANHDKYIPVAFVCVPEVENTHSEKTAIIVPLVGLSCVALTVALIILVGTRVQRGITRVRKVNTLAGKILVSYVSSQLIGYLALGVGTIADFGERSVECYLLTGFLQFFMMAAFCWNTSICMEGFLLTLNVRISELLRYIFHSIWGWGIPAALTAITFLIDRYSDELPCYVVAPKIGVDRCFFSNSTALLLYFYLPISITVLINAVLLVSSKALRNAQLKKLEHNLKVFKIHATKDNVQNSNGGVGQASSASNHTGLRTHQNKNMWMESLRMVLWSGVTWLMEVVGTLVTMYGGSSQGEWYNYLWYLPVGVNCLRGLGIFFLILSTSQHYSKLIKLVSYFTCGLGTSSSKRAKVLGCIHRSVSMADVSSIADDSSDIVNRRIDYDKNAIDRSLSTRTIVSDISLNDSDTV